MLEAYLTALFLLVTFLAVYARLSQGSSARKVDVSSPDLMQAIKRGRRTELDDKIEAKQKRLRERRAHG